MSLSGTKLVAAVRKGSSDIAGYSLYVNGVEQGGISLGGDGTINGYTVDPTKETVVKFTVTDSAGYAASAEMTITPTKSSTSASSNTDSSSTTTNQ